MAVVASPSQASAKSGSFPRSPVKGLKQPPLPQVPVIQNLTQLKEFLNKPIKDGDDNEKKLREEVILAHGKKLSEDKNTEELKAVILAIRPYLFSLGVAKASKIVRQLVDYCLSIDEDPQLKVDLCKECISWANDQNRIYLSQSLSARLIKLLNDIGKYSEAGALITKLSRELRKVDDKEVLMEVQLEESKAMFCLQNFGKSRTALAAARSTANAVYLSPKFQAALDMQSGILHAVEDKDFKTSYSYFFEAFENYDSCDEKNEARRALKYMCLTKIMMNEAEVIRQILTSKLGIKYKGEDLEAIKAVGLAFKTRTLKTFLEAFDKYKKELHEDPVVKAQFATLNENMLEKEICRVIEPYSVVEVDHVSRRIGLSKERIEKKLAQMLLDKKISGRIDQSQGTLAVYKTQAKAPVCEQVVKMLAALNETVDVSQNRAQKLRYGFVNPATTTSEKNSSICAPVTPPQGIKTGNDKTPGKK